MKLLTLMKDGGPHSKVWGYWLIEWKRMFSILILRFEDGSREAYHSHAFNAWSLVISGMLLEHTLGGTVNHYHPGHIIYTPRTMFHKVVSYGTTWVISFRGPWADTWDEWIPPHMACGTLVPGRFIKLTHGRKEVK